MTEDSSFSKLSVITLVASAFAHLFHVLVQPALPIIVFVNLACLYYLTKRACAYSKAGREDFDAVIAAETIVAFGVMSLILGLATALVPLVAGTQEFDLTDSGRLTPLAVPFLEGLVTAGLAPFFAVVLRNYAFEYERGVDSAGDMADLARATSDLVRQLKSANSHLEALETSAREASISTTGLAENLKLETARLQTALHEGQAHVRAFGVAAGEGGSEILKLTDETRRLKDTAGDTATLLDVLGKLIDSVERFVAPAKARP